jgi:hypothetical protein
MTIAKGLAVLIAVVAMHSPCVLAKDVVKKHELTGQYYLNGVANVGSELVLAPSGKFQWALMYENSDRYAQGGWKQTGQQIVLTASTQASLRFRLEERSPSRLPKAGIWVIPTGVPMMGPVGNVEVQFKAKSGKTASAVSADNGDAIVTMPASEKWVRAGLRRARTTDDWQWFDLHPASAETRIALFAITNPEAISPPAFTTLKLRQQANGLVVDDVDMRLGGVYSK